MHELFMAVGVKQEEFRAEMGLWDYPERAGIRWDYIGSIASAGFDICGRRCEDFCEGFSEGFCEDAEILKKKKWGMR